MAHESKLFFFTFKYFYKNIILKKQEQNYT